MHDQQLLNAAIQRYQTIEPIEIKAIDPTTGTLAQGIVVDGNIVHDLTIYDHTLREQVTLVATQIMYWHAMRARAKRVWQIAEREYAVWKAQQRYSVLGEKHPKTDKAYTIAQADDAYRIHPEYNAMNVAVERAEEAYNLCDGLVDAFNAKQRVLNGDVFRAKDGSLQRSSP